MSGPSKLTRRGSFKDDNPICAAAGVHNGMCSGGLAIGSTTSVHSLEMIRGPYKHGGGQTGRLTRREPLGLPLQGVINLTRARPPWWPPQHAGATSAQQSLRSAVVACCAAHPYANCNAPRCRQWPRCASRARRHTWGRSRCASTCSERQRGGQAGAK